MWTELLDIFRGGDELEIAGRDFLRMLDLVCDMARRVRPHVFDHSISMEQRSAIYKLDVEVNKIERAIRKRVITHLTVNPSQVPYSLRLMSLVKDVERIGDYVKNVTEVSELGGEPVPPGPLRDELTDLIGTAAELLEALRPIAESEDRERAVELLQRGRAAGKRCDRLLIELARSDLAPAEVTSMVLLTRFHKRLGAHAVNILSAFVMPLHKIDFFDESELHAAQLDPQ